MIFGRKPNAIARKFTGKITRAHIGNSLKSIRMNIANAKNRSGVEGIIFFRKIRISTKRRTKTLLMVEKKFKPWHDSLKGANSIELQFEILNELRGKTLSKKFIPPTVRVLERNGKKSLLITDLTEGGKYDVASTHIEMAGRPVSWSIPISNERELNEQIGSLQGKLFSSGYHVNRDAFLIQVDKKTLRGLKIWLVDAGLIKRR